MERNALQAGLGLLDDGPAPLPVGWLGRVNGAETEAELAALRCSVVRGSSLGEGS